MTGLTFIALPLRCGSPSFSVGAAIVFGAALAMAPTFTLAEAQVRGTPKAVAIEAKDTSVEEILAALSGAFDLHYRSSANLEKRLNGNYEGSLQSVMKHVLEGYSYIVKTGGGGIHVTVLDTSKTAPTAGASPSFRAVGRPAGAIPAPLSPATAAAEPPVIPASPRASSTVVGRLDGDTPAQRSPAISVVEPPVTRASPAAPSSHRRSHLLADGKESWSSPARRIKMANSSRRWSRSKYHMRQTSLAQSLIFCTRRVRSFGLKMTIPASSYSWSPQGPLHLRSLRNWRADPIRAKSKGLKMNCPLKSLRAVVATRARGARQ